jgi:hypothetical protein
MSKRENPTKSIPIAISENITLMRNALAPLIQIEKGVEIAVKFFIDDRPTIIIIVRLRSIIAYS